MAEPVEQFYWPEGVQVLPIASGNQKAIGILFDGTEQPVALTIGAARQMVLLLEKAIHDSRTKVNGLTGPK